MPVTESADRPLKEISRSIGEALNRLSRVDPQVSHQIGPAPQIISFRNILVHGYDVVDHEVVWEIIRHELPELLKRAQQLLAEVGKETSR